MSTDFLGVPSKGAESIGNVVLAHGELHALIALPTVPVHKNDQVIQLPAGGHVDPFPADSLLELAVATDHIGGIVLALDLGGKGHARADGNAVSERAGGHIQPGSIVHGGVPLEHTV